MNTANVISFSLLFNRSSELSNVSLTHNNNNNITSKNNNNSIASDDIAMDVNNVSADGGRATPSDDDEDIILGGGGGAGVGGSVSDGYSDDDDDLDCENPSKRIAIHEVNVSRYNKEFVELSTIGQGVYGSVNLCRHRLDGCLYAVKRSLKPVVGSSAE